MKAGNMTLWIIIGSLVALVAIFLVVMSIKDRKKAKVVKLEETRIDKIRTESRKNVIVYLNDVIAANEKLLKDFVPSVGKLKMGDIRNKSKNALKTFRNTEEFNYAKDGDSNTKLIAIYKNFEKTNSNIWAKTFNDEIKDLKEAESKMDKDFLKQYKPVSKKLIKDAYK